MPGWGRRLEDQDLEELEMFLQANLFGVRPRPEFTLGLRDHLVSSPEVEPGWNEAADRQRHLLMVAAGAFSAVVLVLLGVRMIAWVFNRSARRGK